MGSYSYLDLEGESWSQLRGHGARITLNNRLSNALLLRTIEFLSGWEKNKIYGCLGIFVSLFVLKIFQVNVLKLVQYIDNEYGNNFKCLTQMFFPQ